MTKEKINTSTHLETNSSPIPEETQNLLTTIEKALLDKKGEDIIRLDVRGLTSLTDYFIVCHATTDVQIKALADSVTKQTRESVGESVWKKEGLDSRRWVILDYVNVVVHIFNKELREFYNLEKMWNDAVITQITEETYQ
ncbi:MAG TPA: ribosome silencing factor [Balneolales bacterium]|nr:ribosome silencing factor [Balneolales bacterium]